MKRFPVGKANMKRFIAVLLVLITACSVTLAPLSYAAGEGEGTTGLSQLSDKQLNSIALLNYMTVLTQEINASSNSRVYLDNVYSDMVNNYNPSAIDENTLSQIRVLLNTIFAYQTIETKRERIQYIYEQNQANAIRKAFPNPLSVLSVVQSGNPLKSLISIVYMAVDSSNSYKSYLSEIESKYIEEGWALDDSAAQNLHESRSEAFQYMVEMCQKNNLDGKLALNENSVKEIVSWENNSNITRRIAFLEKKQETYQAYGKYWLVLAESYYEKGAYAKCLDAIQTYEDLKINVFRKDHDFAKTLSIAVEAASEVYNGDEYVNKAEHYLTLILRNIETDDWLLRYFAAQSYLDLYERTNRATYLQKAYDLAEENVNYLIDQQYAKNEEYLKPITKLESKKTDSREAKKEIKNFNKWLEEERKVAVPPVYQPLVLNCDLLFALAEKRNIKASQKQEIEEMLHEKDRPLFLVQQLENKYYFGSREATMPDIEFDGKTLKIPATLLEQGTSVRVIVQDGSQKKEYSDWVLDEVDRNKQSDPNGFVASFNSKSIKDQKYATGTKVTVEINPPEEANYDTVKYEFKVSVRKKVGVLNDTQFILVK